MDGEFDSQNFVVSDNGMRIYAAVRGNKLYTATWSTKGGDQRPLYFHHRPIRQSAQSSVGQSRADLWKIRFHRADQTLDRGGPHEPPMPE